MVQFMQGVIAVNVENAGDTGFREGVDNTILNKWVVSVIDIF